MRSHVRNRRSARERREGVVMLIVLLVILMATSTAVFSIQNTAFDSRAAGAMRRAATARSASESGAAVVQGLADRRVLDGQTALDNFNGMRAQLCLPSRAPAPTTFLMSVTDATSGADDSYRVKNPDSDPSSPTVDVIGTEASSWQGGFASLAEKWILDETKDSNGIVTSYHYRWVATTFGGYAPTTPFAGPEALVSPDEVRSIHEAVSITQSHYDEQQ